MEDKIYEHPPAEVEADRTVVRLLIKAHYGTRKAARLWQEFLRNEVFMKLVGMQCLWSQVCHKDESLGDDDDACVCVYGGDFMVESRIDVFQEVKAKCEHKVDINLIAIIEPGQGTEVKIVKRNLSWSPTVFTWKANPKHARGLIASLGTAATTKTMRNALDELPWERAKAVSSAGGTATYLAINRPDIAQNIRRANQDIPKPKVRTEARLKRVAQYVLGEPELIWTFPYQEMPTKLVRTGANWTGQNSEDQKCFSCETWYH